MRILFISGLLLLLLPFRTGAQAGKDRDISGGFFVTAPIERPIIDNGELNVRLRAAGLPECRYPALAVGLGLQFQVNRAIFLFSFNKTNRRPKSDSVALAVEYRATTLGVGYDLLRHPWYSLFPYIGFKGCGSNYDYRQKATGSPTLGSYLATPLTYREISNSVAHLDLGAGFSHQIFYLISLRAGVLLPLEKSRWHTNDSKLQLSDAPAVRYEGYVTLTLGLGQVFGGSPREQQRNIFRTAGRSTR